MAESKILNHIDREEIIQKLLDGVSPNNVCEWLKRKYPHPEDYQSRVTAKTISEFRSNYLNVNRDAARLLKKERMKKDLGLPHNKNATAFLEKKDETQEQYEMRVKEVLLQSPTYMDKLKAVAEATLDGPKLIRELVTLVQSRLEVYFNEIATASSVGQALKNDKMFAEYVNLAKDLIKDAKKIDDDYNTQPDEGVVQLNVVHEQVGMIRDVVKDLLREFDPALALEFMERLNRKMAMLKYSAPASPNVIEQAERLKEKIKQIKEEAEGHQ